MPSDRLMKHYSVRVAVVLQDRVTFRRSNNTWKAKDIPVEADSPEAAFPKAIELARHTEPPEGLTVIGAAVIGFSWLWWIDDPNMVERLREQHAPRTEDAT